MMCERCNNIGLKKVYQCLDCYEDGEDDSIMCYSCKQEHIEANCDNETRFKIIDNWENMPNGS